MARGAGSTCFPASLFSTSPAGAGRLDVARIFRVLRGVRATKLLVAGVLKRKAENTALVTGLVAILLVVVSSISILHFEAAAAEPNIKTAEDALWWAFATITTVGYGDRFPTTSEGRFVAAILMAAGVALFGYFFGVPREVVSRRRDKKKKNDELKKLREEVAALKDAIEGRQGRMSGEAAPSLTPLPR